MKDKIGMGLEDFENQHGPSNESQPVKWFKLNKNESAKIIIPRPSDDRPLLGVSKSIYIRGANGSRTIRTTDETYQLLLENDAVPMVKTVSGEYRQKPRIRAIVNVLDTERGEVMAWEVSRAMVNKLAALDKDPDTPPIHDSILKISKRSTGPAAKDVEYDLQQLGEVELTPEQEEACENLYDVEKLAAPHTAEYIRQFLGISDTGADDESDSDKIPF